MTCHDVYRLFLHLLTSHLQVIIETFLPPKYNNYSFKIPVRDAFLFTPMLDVGLHV